MEAEIYPNAPVVLVALEVRHPTADPLPPAERLRIKRRLAARTPIMRSGELARITTAMHVGGGQTAPDVRIEEFPRYFSRDNTTAVSMRTESVVVETTRYRGWEQLRDLVAEVLEARQEVGGVDGVERLGLRYVNEIRVPGGSVHDWAPWVDHTLLGPALIGHEFSLTTAQWQGVTAFAAAPARAVVLRYGPREGFAVDPDGDLKRSTPTPGPFFLMDIDSFWTPDEEVPEFNISNVKMLLATCDELHAPIRRLFERLISDQLRTEVLRHGD